MGQALLIPFENRKKNTVECQFIIGYKGLIDLVRRSGQVSTIEARTVFQNDVFDFEYGMDSKLVHKPALTGRGKPIAFYGVAKLKDGGNSFLVMSVEEMRNIEIVRKSKNMALAGDEFDAMSGSQYYAN
jgi:recombination protein RecT